LLIAAGREAWLAITELLTEGDAHNRVHDVSAGLGLTVGLLRALKELPEGEGVSMRRLAEQWKCDASYVTGVIDHLEARGFAKRRPHPTDRRVKHVVLTASGRRARKKADELLAVPPRAFATLTAAEQRQLRDLMHKIIAANSSIDTSAGAQATPGLPSPTRFGDNVPRPGGRTRR
jgi:DNA-binding MarR family transcriptional regulator